MGYLGNAPADQAIQIGSDTILSSHIDDGVIVNDDINASASISVSKTALAGGTGLTLSTNTLNVDAAQTQITSVGTIGTGVWNASVIASAKLDADTAHLSEAQTFSGAKTFSANAVFNGEVLVNNTSSGNAKLYIKGGGTSTANSLYITDSAGADILYVKDNKSAKFYGTLETVGNATFGGDVFMGGSGASFGDLGIENVGDSRIDLFSNVGDGVRGKAEIFFSTDSSSDHVSCASIVMEQPSGDQASRKGQIAFKVSDGGGPVQAMLIENNLNTTFSGTINTTGTSFNSTGQNYIFNSEYAMYFNVDSTGGTAERFIFGVGRTGTGGGAEWLTLTNSLATFSPAVKFEAEYGDVYRKTRSKRTNGTDASITQDFNLTVTGISSWSGGMIKVRSCGSAANLSTVGYVTNEYRFAQYSGDSFSITAIADQSNEDNMAVSFPTNSGNNLVIRITWTKNLSGTQGYMASDVDVLFYGGFGSLT